ncbi:hypothetical protein [Algoriphagus aquimarinus]|uniref:Uncharacterized protein n=1 Tax=Algoriphagus aquimarinus TaxID=237018 RepID=A0A1I0YS08_9BACT|nr:hypothetical protein [Algoriphagus aquimarinus]SFB15991.1 hypothetical protein SAMN04489723_10517 [Algoriphagus aquimarinus]
MKLTSEQISQIQSSLSGGKIYYDDIRAEMVDHIASKVEDAMEQGIPFEEALESAQKDINPFNFQMKLLVASHLGFFKTIVSNMLKGSILLKSIPLFAVCLFFIYFDQSPEASEKHVKTIFISATVGWALMGLWGGLLKNSKVVAAGNTLWLIVCISQVVLNLDFIVWLGIPPQIAIYLITFLLSLLYIAGLSEVVFQTKKLSVT